MKRIVSAMLCMAVVMSANAGPRGFVAPPAGPPLAPRTHGFMLYLSQPLGGGGGATLHPKLGFRIEQVRMMGNSGAPEADDPIQHRTLLGWQLDDLRNLHASNMKLELGSHVTYDVTHSTFKPVAPHDSRTVSPPRAMLRSSTEMLPLRLRDPPPAKPRPPARASLPQGEM